MRNIQNINIRYGSGVPVPCDPLLTQKWQIKTMKTETNHIYIGREDKLTQWAGIAEENDGEKELAVCFYRQS